MEYQCEGFLEKNRDTVYEEQINILKASQVRTQTTDPENVNHRATEPDQIFIFRTIYYPQTL